MIDASCEPGLTHEELHTHFIIYSANDSMKYVDSLASVLFSA